MTGSVRSSAGLLVRHQRLAWWIFIANLVLAWLSSLPARVSLASALDHSLEGLRFVNGFDVAALAMLLGRPDFPVKSLATTSVAATVVFFFYLLFLDGGVFAVYLDDRKLSRAEFFENCGLYFWRMLRLAIYSLLPFAIVMAIGGGIGAYAGKLSDEAAPDRLGFYVAMAGRLLFLLLFLFVRLWFDLTQASVVRENKRSLLRTLGGTFRIALGSGKLYRGYLGIMILSAAVAAALVTLWVYLPHRAMFASFVVLEMVTLLFIASRLWMKAASARWIALLPEPVYASLAVAPTQESEPEAESPVAPSSESMPPDETGTAEPPEPLPE
jgi:hypothetical protein